MLYTVIYNIRIEVFIKCCPYHSIHSCFVQSVPCPEVVSKAVDVVDGVVGLVVVTTTSVIGCDVVDVVVVGVVVGVYVVVAVVVVVGCGVVVVVVVVIVVVVVVDVVVVEVVVGLGEVLVVVVGTGVVVVVGAGVGVVVVAGVVVVDFTCVVACTGFTKETFCVIVVLNFTKIYCVFINIDSFYEK